MRYASTIAPTVPTKITSQRPLLSGWRARRNLFAIFLDALHYSRRLQAQRTLRQYRHLIDQAQPNILRELNARSGQHEHTVDK